jgi:hypothetical protein
LDTDGANINGISGGNTLTKGDQNSAAQRWGRASSNRTNRFVLSAVYAIPAPSVRVSRSLLGGWSAAGVVTLQSGSALTILYSNATNAFGISDDRAQLALGCSKAALITPGSIENKLGKYFNSSCFTTPPIIGADGIATGFGNSSTGIVAGPGQSNIDLGVARTVQIRLLRESRIQFRADYFNLLNHPQFSNPNTTYGSSSFGTISSTSVNPRVGQLALKLIF